MDPELIIRTAKSRGLDGICITDHNSLDVLADVREGLQKNGLCVVIGTEYDTPLGDFLLFGPFNDLLWTRGLEPGEMLTRLREMGGIAVAAHPFRTGRGVSEEIISQGLCSVIEIFNGRNSEDENRSAEQWIGRYDLVLCGGSDAHEPREIGTFATEIGGDIRNRWDFISAVRSGNCVPCFGHACRIPFTCR